MYILIPAVFLISLAYAAVGLGGGTAYLSVLSFWRVEPATLRPMAWGLNVVVGLVGVWNFRRRGHLELAGIWPFLVGGLAGAALGAALPLGEKLFRLLLGVVLFLVALRMLLMVRQRAQDSPRRSRQWPWLPALFVGFAPGVLAGVVGIGGGVVLGPVIVVLGWLTAKRAAALTALYVLLNSLGALAVHFGWGGSMPWTEFAILALVVVIGGFFGSRFGAGRASPVLLQRIFGLVALAASINLLVEF